MLEDLAVDLWSQEGALGGVALLFGFIGAILAGIASFASRSKSTISRLRYFGYGVMLWAIVQAVVFIVIQMRTEVPNGALWPPTMILLGSSAAIGFQACRLSMSRSRDAFGHGYWAFLGFVPFGVLFLWFWPSKKAKVAATSSNDNRGTRRTAPGDTTRGAKPSSPGEPAGTLNLGSPNAYSRFDAANIHTAPSASEPKTIVQWEDNSAEVASTWDKRTSAASVDANCRAASNRATDDRGHTAVTASDDAGGWLPSSTSHAATSWSLPALERAGGRSLLSTAVIITGLVAVWWLFTPHDRDRWINADGVEACAESGDWECFTLLANERVRLLEVGTTWSDVLLRRNGKAVSVKTSALKSESAAWFHWPWIPAHRDTLRKKR